MKVKTRYIVYLSFVVTLGFFSSSNADPQENLWQSSEEFKAHSDFKSDD